MVRTKRRALPRRHAGTRGATVTPTAGTGIKARAAGPMRQTWRAVQTTCRAEPIDRPWTDYWAQKRPRTQTRTQHQARAIRGRLPNSRLKRPSGNGKLNSKPKRLSHNPGQTLTIRLTYYCQSYQYWRHPFPDGLRRNREGSGKMTAGTSRRRNRYRYTDPSSPGRRHLISLCDCLLSQKWSLWAPPPNPYSRGRAVKPQALIQGPGTTKPNLISTDITDFNIAAS